MTTKTFKKVDKFALIQCPCKKAERKWGSEVVIADNVETC